MTSWQKLHGEVLTQWKEGSRDWRKVAALIISWEESKSPTLNGVPPGMNKWLKSLACELNFGVSNLWRYRKAAKSAIQLWGKDYDIKTPTLIPEHMRPESIELVEKISRAAPSEVVSDVAMRLYNNQISRNELRRIWQSMRHVIKDNSRSIPIYHELPKADARRRGELLEELCFEALRRDLHESESPVLGSKGMCFRDDQINKMIVDIIAVTEDEHGCALYHGVEIKTSLRHVRSLDMLQNIFKHFDYIWIVAPDMDNFKLVPEEVGILQYIDGGLKLIRKPVCNQNPDLQLVSRRIVPYMLKMQMKE